MNADYRKFIESPRVSPQTRAALLERGEPDDPAYEPQALSPEQLQTLRRVLSRVVPQGNAGAIDLAARLDRQIATGKGDGWRYAELPADPEALRIGLGALDSLAKDAAGSLFERLPDAAADDILEGIASGRLRSVSIDLRLWFEDLRANAVQLYVSHPETLAAMGYSGIADDPHGFVKIGIGEKELWEPVGPLEPTAR